MKRFQDVAGFLYFVPLFAAITFISPMVSYSQDEIPDAVMEIFEKKCSFSGCHAGASSGNDLDLSEDVAFSALVNQPSLDFSSLNLVEAGNPLKSYLIMKLVGTSGIKGELMPTRDKPISKAELRTIASWIQSLPKGIVTPRKKRKSGHSFPGLTVGSLQTAQTVSKGTFSYRIAHRWLGRVDSGFDQFFGLDAGAHMLTELSFAISNGFTITLGRSGSNATYEFYGKWQLFRETAHSTASFSAALLGGVDWLALKQISDPNAPGQLLSRTNSERFAWYGQLIVSKQLSRKVTILFSPGILLNGNVAVANEDPIFTIGLAGKVQFGRRVSVFVEISPILSGLNTALPVGGAATNNGQPTVYDAFTVGLEHSVCGHVFHVYITNSLGLTPSQVMSGGNLNAGNGEFRLGFNIYRALRTP